MILGLTTKLSVSLTNHGSSILEEHQNKYGKFVETNLVVELSLAEVLEIFGSHTFFGSKPCFEQLEILSE